MPSLCSALFLVACGPFVQTDQNNATLLSIESWEDCVGFNPATTQASFVGGEWKVVDGSHWLFSFGASQANAEKTAALIKTYQFANSCFVGRPGPSMTYQLTSAGNPATGATTGEDCIPFNNANVQVKWFADQQSWKMVDGNMWMLDFGNNQAEASTALRVVKKYKFNRQCFVGRPNPGFAYWKTVATPPPAMPDLGAYGFLKIGKSQRLVRWNEVINLTPADAFLISNGVPAFDLYYTDKNYGTAPASGYRNAWSLDNTLVSQQPNRALAAGAQYDIHTQAYLRVSPGRRLLQLKIDADGVIAESSETNNTFQVYVTFSGF